MGPKANVKLTAAKTVTAGLVLPTSSLVQVVLLDPTAGLAKVLLDPSTLTHMVLLVEAVEVVETSEAVATVEEVAAATVEALLVALVMDSGRMAFMFQALRT